MGSSMRAAVDKIAADDMQDDSEIANAAKR